MIKVRRVYDTPKSREGRRYLVDGLWPRGIKKVTLSLDGWLRDVAPSTALRKWFGHDPMRWAEFQRRYAAELDRRPEKWRPIVEAARLGNVTLLFGARDLKHNNAVALKKYLEKRVKKTS